MKYHQLTAIHAGESGWVGTVTDQHGEELYGTGTYHSAHGAFNVAFLWVEKHGEKS